MGLLGKRGHGIEIPSESHDLELGVGTRFVSVLADAGTTLVTRGLAATGRPELALVLFRAPAAFPGAQSERAALTEMTEFLRALASRAEQSPPMRVAAGVTAVELTGTFFGFAPDLEFDVDRALMAEDGSMRFPTGADTRPAPRARPRRRWRPPPRLLNESVRHGLVRRDRAGDADDLVVAGRRDRDGRDRRQAAASERYSVLNGTIGHVNVDASSAAPHRAQWTL